MLEQDMEIVIVESPYAGDVATNINYARAIMHDCLVNHQEAPYASHLLYTQPGVLDDDDPNERKLGIGAGFMFRKVAVRSVVGFDLGLSAGMLYGIIDSIHRNTEVVYRTLPTWRMPGSPMGIRVEPNGFPSPESLEELVAHNFKLSGKKFSSEEFDRFITPFTNALEVGE